MIPTRNRPKENSQKKKLDKRSRQESSQGYLDAEIAAEGDVVGIVGERRLWEVPGRETPNSLYWESITEVIIINNNYFY